MNLVWKPNATEPSQILVFFRFASVRRLFEQFDGQRILRQIVVFRRVRPTPTFETAIIYRRAVEVRAFERRREVSAGQVATGEVDAAQVERRSEPDAAQVLFFPAFRRVKRFLRNRAFAPAPVDDAEPGDRRAVEFEAEVGVRGENDRVRQVETGEVAVVEPTAKRDVGEALILVILGVAPSRTRRRVRREPLEENRRRRR